MFATSLEVSHNRSPVPSSKIFMSANGNPVHPYGGPAIGSDPAAADVLDPIFRIATIVQFDRDSGIIAQGEEAEYCFQVVTGCVRTVKVLEDGRRQVGEFLLPGDIFGWETVGEHEFAAEAVTAVALRRVRIAALEERADNDRAFAQKLRRYTAGQVRLTRGRLVLLGRKNACERIASFLLEMDTRLRASGSTVMALPMGRGDMADYIGLTIETVCRGLTELRLHGMITVDRARIAITDRHALALAGSGRRC